jgi:hypothetical protein
MPGVVRDRRALRGAALMPAAALALHQLRYRLAFGARAPHELAAQGHAYLSTLAPWIALLAALGAGAALGRLARRWAAGGGGRALGGAQARGGRSCGAVVRLWLLASAALLAIYCGQELLEGVFAAGHRAGLAGVLGAGGWWALPLALAAGGLLALALHWERAAERALDARRPPLRLRICARLAGLAPLVTPASPLLPAPAPLARAAASRAPPRAPAAAHA